jgi:hypothetical protein
MLFLISGSHGWALLWAQRSSNQPALTDSVTQFRLSGCFGISVIDAE